MALAEGWQIGLGGVVAAALAWSLALLVLFLRPDRASNRLLALLLACEGAVSVGGVGLTFFTTDVATGFGLQALTFLAYLMIGPTELLFLGTLPGPLARPLASPRVRRIILLVAALEVVAFFTFQEHFIVLQDGTYGPGPAQALLFLLSSLVHVYALAVAVSGLRAAVGDEARRRARAYAVAFGFRNVGFIVVIVGTFVPRYGEAINVFGFQAVAAFFVMAAAYAILRTQLFDVDLRIKRTISRGTVVATFAGVFFVVGVVAENFLSERYGYLVGGVSAGFLLLGLQPLQRLGRRVADTAMPHVQDTPAYVAFRKMEVYKAAVEGAIQDGEVTPKEREVLRRLRQSLGLSDADADALERDLATRAGT